jgi:glycosyltransferase involved in cell wall biosynthesis
MGGAEALCRALARALEQAGTVVEVFTTCALDHFSWEDAVPAGSTIEDRVPVHRFPVGPRDPARFSDRHHGVNRGDELDPAQQIEWMTHSVWSPGLLDALADRDREIRCRVAMPYLFGTTYWAVAQAPQRTVLLPCLHDEAHAQLGVVRNMLEASAGCIANVRAEQRLIQRIAPRAKSSVGGFGFSPLSRAVEGDLFCKSRGIEPGYLLYAGRREEAKGLPMLFSLYARFVEERPDAPPLALMGSGDLAPPREIRDRVIDLGLVSEDQKHDAMAGASILVHPSHMESFGAVLIEAWQANVPALVYGRSEVLVDHCRAAQGGLWFDDYASFAFALDRLLSDPSLRRQLGDNGSRYVSDVYGWDAVLGRFHAALDQWV